jgi:hypothetical protein
MTNPASSEIQRQIPRIQSDTAAAQSTFCHPGETQAPADLTEDAAVQKPKKRRASGDLAALGGPPPPPPPHKRQLVRGLPFRNKVDAGNSSCIWGPKARIRPQCRVTTPLWAPGADFGQREKKRNRRQNSDRRMAAARDPGVAGR